MAWAEVSEQVVAQWEERRKPESQSQQLGRWDRELLGRHFKPILCSSRIRISNQGQGIPNFASYSTFWISGWGCSGIPGMAPAGTLVASDAGGWAEACEHGSCRNEVHHCCAICEKRLCHVHWHSPCPHVDPPIDPPPTPPLEQQPPPLPPTLPPPDTGAAVEPPHSPSQSPGTGAVVEPPHSPSQSPGTGAAIGHSWSRHSPRPRRRLVRKTNLKDRRPHCHRHHHHSPPPPPPPLPNTTATATTATRIYSLVRPRGDGLAVSIPVAVVLSSHCCG